MGLNKLWEFGDGQGGLACWDSWSRKESDMTEQLNWTEKNIYNLYPIKDPDAGKDWRQKEKRSAEEEMLR